MNEAVLYVRDLERITTFYRDCLGLTAGETGDGYCGLRSDGFVLWLVRGQQPSDAAEADATVPSQRRSGVPVKLAFAVSGFARVAAAIQALGGTIDTAEWTFAGYRRRDAVDPEGNIIQLLEPLGPSSTAIV